jgi:hypothetical protein
MTDTKIDRALPNSERQAAALRATLWFFDQHPQLPEQPYVIVHGTPLSAGKADLSWFFTHDEDGLEKAIATRRAIGGRWTKDTGSDVIYMHQTRASAGGVLALTIAVDREQACTRRVVGTREVEVPAQPATPATTRTVEDVEWDCHPLLAGDE